MTLPQKVELLTARIARLERDLADTVADLRAQEEKELARLAALEAERLEYRELYSLGMR